MLYQVNMVLVYISSSEKSLRLLENITKQKLCPYWGELELRDLKGPFQHKPFYNSMILCTLRMNTFSYVFSWLIKYLLNIC